jgi:hypothetical protein
MEQAFGRQPAAIFERYMNSYKIETADGVIIIKSRRTPRRSAARIFVLPLMALVH